MRSGRVSLQDGTPRSMPDAQSGWGLTQTDEEWSTVLETALMATRRDDLKHGTVAALRGCICKDCRQIRLARNR